MHNERLKSLLYLHVASLFRLNPFRTGVLVVPFGGQLTWNQSQFGDKSLGIIVDLGDKLLGIRVNLGDKLLGIRVNLSQNGTAVLKTSIYYDNSNTRPTGLFGPYCILYTWYWLWCRGGSLLASNRGLLRVRNSMNMQHLRSIPY